VIFSHLTTKILLFLTSFRVKYNVFGFRSSGSEVESYSPNTGLKPPEGYISDQLNPLEQ
jgi:hypothetical protein